MTTCLFEDIGERRNLECIENIVGKKIPRDHTMKMVEDITKQEIEKTLFGLANP